MVVARVAGHLAMRERLAGVVLVVDEARPADPVRDLMAVGMDGSDMRESSVASSAERLLRSLAVREVAERLSQAVGLAAPPAVGDRRVVRLEGEARARAARGGGDEGRRPGRSGSPRASGGTRACRCRRCALAARPSTGPASARRGSGPTCPFAPAASSVWQPPQPALAKTFAPGELEVAARPAAACCEREQSRRGGRLLARSFMTRCLGTIALWP